MVDEFYRVALASGVAALTQGLERTSETGLRHVDGTISMAAIVRCTSS